MPLKFSETHAWPLFLREMCHERLIANVHCDTVSVEAYGLRMPVTANLSGDASISWVASLRNAYGPYARAESRMVGMPWPQVLAGDVVSLIGEQALKLTGLADALMLNNWLVSTNLYTQNFDIDTIELAREKLAQQYPGKPVVVRSLMREYHGELIANLQSKGWLFFPSRQVWLVDHRVGSSFRQRRDLKADLKLAKEKRYQGDWVGADTFSDDDWKRGHQLYEQLYRGKYPHYNPAYSIGFLKAAYATQWLDIRGWRNRSGVLDGVIGLLRRPGWMSCPLLGYDLSQSVEEGLYRRVNLQTLLAAEQEGRTMHLSSGAGAFKKSRGATCAVEFVAAYVSKGPVPRKIAAGLSHALMKHAVPVLESRVF